ncbi:expressed unknown protein [Seminavis robusta]|uniref:Uncharacterized protein n=1 Tax=Seminavis robusta TaxID=568900 RepID=A0A9N8DEQ2_9STRA|nr:expressed unknown protein [Seminavis robusta]|eukprot:Sro36_g022670.1 n/a (442) ;mRNA; f:12900-14225
MSDPTTSCTTTNNSRRVSTMKKRYANLAPGLAAKAGVVEEPRRSVILEMERIPSFRRLNGDSLFEEPLESSTAGPSSGAAPEDNGFIVRRSGVKGPRRTTVTNRRTGHHERRHQRSSKRDNNNRRKRGSIQIPETKVMVQRVSPQEDALFMDESCKTLNTETTASTTSTHSSLEDSLIFATSSSELEFDDNDDDFFRVMDEFVEDRDRNHKSCGEMHLMMMDQSSSSLEGPLSASCSSLKYRNLGQRVQAAHAIVADEVHFVPPNTNPSDLMPLVETNNRHSNNSSTAKENSTRSRRSTRPGRRGRRSRSLTTEDDFRGPRKPMPLNKKSSSDPTVQKDSTTSHHSRRSGRRSSLGGSSPQLVMDDETLSDALQLLEVVQKSDDYGLKKNKQQMTTKDDKLSSLPPQWSLPKLLSRGHRRTLQLKRQQQQEEMCQQFFGEQ